MAEKTTGFPAPAYAELLLGVNFADAQRLFLPHLLQIHYAHTLMLARQQILPRHIAQSCLQGLRLLDEDAIAAARYDGKTEDLFFFVERELTRTCGADAAGWMHTARSRNDIDATQYRMRLRDEILRVHSALLEASGAVLSVARQHHRSLMPAYTHAQPAQPITLGHYLAGAAEVLARDAGRLQAAFATVDRCPLGACAISTTGFPIDREYTAELLGFASVQVNSYGAIAASDYLTETAGALATAMINLGRLAQDFLMWSTAEFGYVRLSDAWVQISSIMPQKRNPVPLEHVRALASKAVGNAHGVFWGLHNTPWADTNDAGDDLQPVVAEASTDARRALLLFAGLLRDATFDVPRMEQRAQGAYLTVTELADTLVRREGMSFREAHGFVAATVKALQGNAEHEAIAAHLLTALGQRASNTTLTDLLHALDARAFVEVRTVTGGPAAVGLQAALEKQVSLRHEAEQWNAAQQARLTSAQVFVQSQTDRLLL